MVLLSVVSPNACQSPELPLPLLMTLPPLPLLLLSLLVVSVRPLTLIPKQINYMLMFVAPLCLLAGWWLSTLHAPRRAAVSSFGIGGTNAHAVLERAPDVDAGRPDAAPDVPLALPISARAPEALRELARRYDALLARDGGPAWVDLAHAAALGRSHHEHRLALVARDREGARAGLAAFLRGEPCEGLTHGRRDPSQRPRVAFVFGGQGSQWRGMGRALLEDEPDAAELDAEELDSRLERLENAADPAVVATLVADLAMPPAAPLAAASHPARLELFDPRLGWAEPPALARARHGDARRGEGHAARALGVSARVPGHRHPRRAALRRFVRDRRPPAGHRRDPRIRAHRDLQRQQRSAF